MPVEVENTSQLEEFTRVLRRRIWWILVPFTIIATLGSAYAVLVPKKYVAKTRILVRELRNRQTGQIIAGSEAQGRAAKLLLHSPTRVRQVVQTLRWPWETLTAIEKEDLVEKVLDDLAVEAPAMGPGASEQMVTIRYGDTDPDRAMDFAEEMSRRWREEVLEGNRKAKQRAFNNLDERTRAIERRIEQIAGEIAALMDTHGIPPWTPNYKTERPLAPEFERMPLARREYAVLEEEIELAILNLERKEARYDRMGDVVPYVETIEGTNLAKEIRSRREDILELENLLGERGYKPTHSKWTVIQKKIQVLEAEIAMLEDASTSATTVQDVRENVAKIELGQEIEDLHATLQRKQAKLEELAIEIANLVAKTGELQTVYQKLASLEDERDLLNGNREQFNLDLQAMRTELDLANTPAGDPFVVLDAVERPTRPTEPDPVLITIFSVLIGLALGLALAMALEYSKSCFRNVNDVTRVMVVPVLGAVGAIVTGAQVRRKKIGRRLLASTTILFVLLVGYVTWAWSYRQDLLSDGLLQSIEGFRRSLE